MEQDKSAASVNRSEQTLISEAEKASHSPRFDERSIRRAQPAVPLGRAGASRRVRRPSPLALLAALAAVVGLVAGAVGASVYMSRRASPRASAVETTQTAPPPPATAASEEELFKPAASDLPDVSAPEATTVAETGDAGAPDSTADAGVGDTARAADEQAVLREALDGWLNATNARDIGRQMSYYDTRLEAFYLSRNTSAQAVRAEKVRVFNSADTIDVQANGPAAVRLNPDGRTATMRFRKRYRIAGGGQDRRGEVVQELRWRKTGDGWKIISERDVRVLN